jgi:hypothetical protein
MAPVEMVSHVRLVELVVPGASGIWTEWKLYVFERMDVGGPQ